jgi:NADH-quinone oxidoreductase subunit L
LIPYAQWLVWIIPIVSSLFVPIITRLNKKARDYFAVLTSMATLITAFSITLDLFFSTTKSIEYDIPWIPSIGITAGVLIDPLSALFVNMIAFFGFVIILYSLGYMAGEEGLTRYYFFMLLFIGSMIGLVVADNFLQIFVFWEMVGLCSYSLISFWYKRPEAVRAGIKVFLTTRIGDVCLLAGIGVIYASLGSFSFSYTVAHIGDLPLPTLGAIAFLMLGAAIAKSAQLPLHTWLYSAMEAPTSVSALLHSATMVKAGIYLVARLFILFGPLLAAIPMWLPSVAWIGVLTAFVGATLALHTPDIKGVLAYSTISQLGFMVAALGTASSSSSLGWFASLFHMVSHAFFEGLGFLIAGGIIHAVGTRDMRLMGGLRKEMLITFGFGIIVLLTCVGMPPFAGFFSKELIISSILFTGNIWLVLLIYASTAFTFAYNLRFVILVFFRRKARYLDDYHVHEPPKIMLFSSAILAVLCFVWGFLGPLFSNFMRVDVEIDWLGAVFSLETIIIMFIFFLGGIPVYLFYFRKTINEKISRLLSPLATVLKHGYFFDHIYEKIIAKSIIETSKTVLKHRYFFDDFYEKIIAKAALETSKTVFEHRYFFDDFYEKIIAKAILEASNGILWVEVTVLERFPQLIVNGVIGIAYAIHKYFAIFADELLNIIVHRTFKSASKIQIAHSGSLQRYITAALIGFILILILIILTIPR